MQLNVFSWIREGVRQAVILGVSDAVDELGEPNGQGSLRQQLNEALAVVDPEPPATTRRSTRSRKRISRAAEIEVE